MRNLAFAIVLACAFTSGARASDQPVLRPAPAWVRPVTAPAAKPDDQAAVRVLLLDQQVSLEAGQQTLYSAVSLKIQTPQGLTAGNLSFPWRPETDELAVHRLVIRRGSEVIDVLASGQTFTVLRREQNLESATLDGVLTANIQPEGLQVGDTVEFAVSVTSRDPVLKGHVEQFAGAWNDVQIRHAHLRIQWPATLPARIRVSGSAVALKPVTTNGISSVEMSLDDVEPIAAPKGAPMRYRIGRLVELSDFGSWAELGALMAPLYLKAAIVPVQGSLRNELERIRASSADPDVQAQAALALVQDKIRYVALAMGPGGLIPADAQTTWSRRYGDCKGKTALLLALLHELGISAEPVLVNTVAGDGLDARLPMVRLFNHVLVRATLAGKTYWLDGTRTGDTSLARLSVPAFGWGLPAVPSGAALVQITPAPLDNPTHSMAIHIDASAGLTAPAPARVETILRGDEATEVNAGLANVGAEARNRTLTDYWKSQFEFITIKSVAASFDPRSAEMHLTMDGEAKMDWSNGSYQTDGTGIGYRADFSRDQAADAEVPFAVLHPYFTRVEETIVLPAGHGEFRPGAGLEVDQTIAGIQYRRHATITDNVFRIEKSERSLVSEFPAREATAAQAALRTLADHPAILRKPPGYTATDKEVAVAHAEHPVTAFEYGRRAGIFLDRGMRAEALLDYDKAIELDPQDVWAWSNRAITRIQTGDLPGAKADLERAQSLDPTYVQIFIARGMLAELEHRPRDAVVEYSNALGREPDKRYALAQRAQAYRTLGQSKLAVADLAAIKTADIAADPDMPAPYVDRGKLLLDDNRFAEAIADFDRAATLDPGNAEAIALRAMARSWNGDGKAAASDLAAALAIAPRKVPVLLAQGVISQHTGALREAIAAYTSALAIEPGNNFAVGHRAEAEDAIGDDEATLRDTAVALRQRPQWTAFYLLRANIFRRQKKPDQALAEAGAAIANSPNDAYAHVVAANIYSSFGKTALAMAAYDRAIAIEPEAYIYLNRGLRRPAGDLAGRRADIDAALKLDPALDEAIAEKARMQADAGDLSGAVSTYTTGLARLPASSVLLAGRGMAYARRGNKAAADRDFARARAMARRPAVFNQMCWAKASAGVALEAALDDCNAALAMAPDVPSYFDSRGLALLRLGRIDNAIADFDQALSRSTNLPTSLFGRAIAWARKGEQVKARDDAARAEAIDPQVRTQFEGFGLTL
jgi:tetratricopeptide (TPR) repeat protein